MMELYLNLYIIQHQKKYILGISKKQLLKSSRQDHIIGHVLVLGPDIPFNLDQMQQNSLTVNTINEYTGNLQIFDELETEDPIYF